MAKKQKKKSDGSITNKKGLYDFEVIQKYKAGMVLVGSEVKSLRMRAPSFVDAFCFYKGGELWMKGVHIPPWQHAGVDNHKPLRLRKLLLSRGELSRLRRKLQPQPLTVIPLRIFKEKGLTGGNRTYFRVEIALARGRKKFDKRNLIKERDLKRKMRQQGDY